MRALSFVLTIAVGLALATPTLGQDAGQNAGQNVGLSSRPRVDVTGFSGDPAALPKAVSNIETLSGGRVVEIRYSNADGVPSYDVVLAKGPEVKFQRFSRPNGVALDLTESTMPSWMLDWRGKKTVSVGEKAKVHLSEAIRTAEESMGGAPAVAAGVARSASNPSTEVHAYNVAILKDGEQHRVAVDSRTGSVISNPEVLAEW